MESLINKKDWKIDIETERKFWIKNLLNVFIILPDKCKACNKGVICLRNNNSLINPLLGKCNWYKFNKELYLRKKQNFSKS